MPNRLTNAVDGATALTAAVWNNEFDNIYSGVISRTGGSLGAQDDVQTIFGSSDDAMIEFNTDQTVDALVIGVDTTGRTLIICDKGDESTNFGFAARTEPTIIVKSATAATNDYIEYSAGLIRFHNTAVAHGITSVADTDVFGLLQLHDTTGALNITGLGETSYGLTLTGDIVTEDTTKTTGAVGAITLHGAKKSGTTTAAVGADGNLMVIRNFTTARFIFDAEGSAHADVEWTTFDSYDDIALINDFEHGLTKGFGEFLTYNQAAVEAAGIAHFDETPGHAMVNFTRLSMLLCGALRQCASRIATLEQKLLEA